MNERRTGTPASPIPPSPTRLQPSSLCHRLTLVRLASALSLSLLPPRSVPLSLFSLSRCLSLFLSFVRSLARCFSTLFLCLSLLPALFAAQRSRTRSVAAVDPYAAKHRNTSAHWPRLLASPTDSHAHRGAVLRSTSVRNRCKLFTLGLSRLYRWRGAG